MTDATTTTPVVPRPRSTRRKRIVIGLFALVAIAAAGYLWLSFWAGRELRAALAEADHLDPGWRLDELEAAREAIPDAENAALRLLAAHALLPLPWPTWPAALTQKPDALQQSFTDLPANEQLSQLQIDALAAVLKDATPALAEVRKLKDLPRGRYRLVFKDDDLWVQVSHVRPAQDIIDMLGYEAMFQLQRGDGDAALDACCALLHAAGSVGDEPSVYSPRWRLQCRAIACRKIERALAQVQPSARVMAELQHRLADEEVQPLFLIGTRTQRAIFHRLFEKLRSSEFRRKFTGSFVIELLVLTGLNSDHAATLKLHTDLVEIARLPVEERGPLVEEKLSTARLPLFAQNYILPKIQKLTSDLHQGELRTRAELRCVIAGLAAERYRQERGAWPADLAALVPRWLEQPLTDPYDGKALRWQRTKDGVVIYSVGPDRQDNAGALDATGAYRPGTDIGVRVWDVHGRRRLAPVERGFGPPVR